MVFFLHSWHAKICAKFTRRDILDFVRLRTPQIKIVMPLQAFFHIKMWDRHHRPLRGTSQLGWQVANPKERMTVSRQCTEHFYFLGCRSTFFVKPVQLKQGLVGLVYCWKSTTKLNFMKCGSGYDRNLLKRVCNGGMTLISGFTKRTAASRNVLSGSRMCIWWSALPGSVMNVTQLKVDKLT